MHSSVSAETEQRMAELYDGGLSVKEIAAMTGVSRYTVYTHTKLRQRINPETEQPFESLSQYNDYCARQRQNRATNRELSDLIPRELGRLGRNQLWLATQLGIDEAAVSRYVNGETTPRASLQGRLFEALGLPYKTIGDLVREKEH